MFRGSPPIKISGYANGERSKSQIRSRLGLALYSIAQCQMWKFKKKYIYNNKNDIYSRPTCVYTSADKVNTKKPTIERQYVLFLPICDIQ